jgi:SAM-dependent methyltransferase
MINSRPEHPRSSLDASTAVVPDARVLVRRGCFRVMNDMSLHHRRETCRICGGGRHTLFLPLGPTPLANAFLRTPDEFAAEPSFPLDMYFCEDCSFVQLLDVVDHEALFRHYLYATGTSDTIAAHNRDLAASLVAWLGLGADDLVVEAASNDGSLLRCFQAHGIRTLGVEPARNLAAVARSAGVDTVDCFFDREAAGELRLGYGPAAVVIGNNVLAHVDDPRDFLAGARVLLRPGGVVAIEVPYIAELLDRLEYDTVYHEHLGYFSVAALVRLADAAGLSLVRVDRVAVHGGSLRACFMAREDEPSHAPGVLALAAAETRAGLTTLGRYQQFSTDVQENRRSLVALLQSLVDAGHTVAGYGAPAKGNTLLNYCRIDGRLVPYTVDKSPLKIGLYTPGAHIPVHPVAALLERQPDYVLLLAWNFAEEIMRQQQEYRARGGRFIIPIPTPVVV